MPDHEFLIEARTRLMAASFFAALAFSLVSVVLTVADEGFSGLTVAQWFGPALFLFFGLTTVSQSRRPARISAKGIRQRTVNWHRYDTFVPWSQVDRMWFERVRGISMLLMTLHDPAAVAGPNESLSRQMRAARRKRGADLIVPLIQVRPSRAEIAAAISLHSGGRVLVENTGPVDQLR